MIYMLHKHNKEEKTNKKNSMYIIYYTCIMSVGGEGLPLLLNNKK